MIGIILAAGEGTRLRPYTFLTPKPLFTIKGIPLITYNIEKLNNLGIKNEDIFVVVSYLQEEVRGFLKKFHSKVNVIEQIQNKKGTSAALESAKNFVKDEDIIVVYGDIFFEDDLKEFCRFDWGIGVYKVEDVSKFGKIVSENGYLKEIREKTESGEGEIFAGILKVKKEFFDVLEKVKQNEKSGEYYLTDAILLQNKKTKFRVYSLKGFWIDIGNEEALKKARTL